MFEQFQIVSFDAKDADSPMTPFWEIAFDSLLNLEDVKYFFLAFKTNSGRHGRV